MADAAVEPGGCVAEIGSGRIDAQLGTALERVANALGATPRKQPAFELSSVELSSVETSSRCCQPSRRGVRVTVPGALLEQVAVARSAAAPARIGRVIRVVGLHLEIEGIEAAVGELVMVERDGGQVEAEVVALQDGRLVCMPFGELNGIRHGSPATANGGLPEIQVGDELLGRVLDGHGRPIDNGPALVGLTRVPLAGIAPHPLRRARVDTPLPLGVRALDTLTPCGRGQRLGIFAGSGVGKSSLLSMIARGSDADISVIALIGERGREVGEFIERDLGPRDWHARSLSSPPAMSRHSSGSVRRSRRCASPSGSAISVATSS